MKSFTSLAFLCASFLITSVFTSCEKDEAAATKSKEQLIVGTWEINRIQLKVFYGGVFTRDTILKQNPRPKNYITFGAAGEFAYKWNLEALDAGSFQFKGADSIITTAIPDAHRFKLLTLTDDLLTLKNTYSNEPLFPGATVEKYHTLIR
jgi:hypothetical protein